MQIEIKLEDENSIAKKISLAISKKLDNRINKNNILFIFKSEIKKNILNDETWKSLSGSEPNGLDADFGIPKEQNSQRLNAILDTWINSINIEKQTKFVGNGLKYQIRVYGILSDFSDVTSLPESIVITEKGRELEWLKWLLLEGDKTLIDNYEVLYGNFSERSRSGKAIMVVSPSDSFSVNPEHSGRINSNFITRALDSLSSSQVIQRAIYKEIKNGLS